MTPENFCYWLQGHLELSTDDYLSKDQLEVIKDHLNLVFKKETRHYIPKLGDIQFTYTDAKKYHDNTPGHSC
jgi:hypothetical protein